MAIPIARRLSFHLGVVDLPKELGVHHAPVPRAGGAAIFFGWLVAIAVAWLAELVPPGLRFKLLGVVLAASLVHVLGLIDDFRGLRAWTRLAGEAVAGSLLVLSGVGIDAGLPSWLGAPLSIVWFVGLMNAINFLDGMDGLAAGFGALGAIALAGLAILKGDGLVLILAMALLGSLLAFLRHNVHPATIFMGDGGSLLLGLQLAILSAMLTQGQITSSWIAAPFLVLTVPILDTTGAIVRRLRARRPIFDGDRRHAYDLLFSLGLSQPQTVRAMWLVSAVFGLCALALALQPGGAVTTLLAIGATGAVVASAAKLGLFCAHG